MSEVFVLQFYDVREIQDSFIYVEEPEILGVFRSYEEAQAFARDQQDEWLDAIQTTADLTNPPGAPHGLAPTGRRSTAR